MMQVVVAVFDRAALLYGRPFFVRATGEAIRSFTDEVNRKGGEVSQFSTHPDDFDLCQLGVYDDQVGSFENAPLMLVRGKDVVIREV